MTENIKIIKKILKTTHYKHKSYVNNRRRALEFEVGDKVFLKLSLWEGVIRFGRKRKLSPRYVGPYEILGRVRPVAYKLRLLAEFFRIRNVCHFSMLRKYMLNFSCLIQDQPLEVQENLIYEERPLRVLDRKE